MPWFFELDGAAGFKIFHQIKKNCWLRKSAGWAGVGGGGHGLTTWLGGERKFLAASLVGLGR